MSAEICSGVNALAESFGSIILFAIPVLYSERLKTRAARSGSPVFDIGNQLMATLNLKLFYAALNLITSQPEASLSK
jgi:hypothetical protein